MVVPRTIALLKKKIISNGSWNVHPFGKVYKQQIQDLDIIQFDMMSG